MKTKAITVTHVDWRCQRVDVLTKTLSVPLFKRHSEWLMTLRDGECKHICDKITFFCFIFCAKSLGSRLRNAFVRVTG